MNLINEVLERHGIENASDHLVTDQGKKMPKLRSEKTITREEVEDGLRKLKHL